MLVKMSCSKCGKKFETDPRLATLIILCPECNLNATFGMPPGFDKIFSGTKKGGYQ